MTFDHHDLLDFFDFRFREFFLCPKNQLMLVLVNSNFALGNLIHGQQMYLANYICVGL